MCIGNRCFSVDAKRKFWQAMYVLSCISISLLWYGGQSTRSRLCTFRILEQVHNFLRSGLLQLQGSSEPVPGTDSLLVDTGFPASYAESPTAQSHESNSSVVAPVALESVYVTGKSEMKFTTLTGKFTGTIDYILYSVDSGVEIARLLRVPGEEDASTTGGFPNIHHPSDHLPLGVDIVFHD